MKILLLSATLIGAGLVIAGPAMAQPTPEKIKPIQTAQRNDSGSSDQGMNRDTTTGLSSAKKEREEAGASAASSNTGPASTATSGMSRNDHTTKGQTGKKAEPD